MNTRWLNCDTHLRDARDSCALAPSAANNRWTSRPATTRSAPRRRRARSCRPRCRPAATRAPAPSRRRAPRETRRRTRSKVRLRVRARRRRRSPRSGPTMARGSSPPSRSSKAPQTAANNSAPPVDSSGYGTLPMPNAETSVGSYSSSDRRLPGRHQRRGRLGGGSADCQRQQRELGERAAHLLVERVQRHQQQHVGGKPPVIVGAAGPSPNGVAPGSPYSSQSVYKRERHAIDGHPAAAQWLVEQQHPADESDGLSRQSDRAQPERERTPRALSAVTPSSEGARLPRWRGRLRRLPPSVARTVEPARPTRYPRQAASVASSSKLRSRRMAGTRYLRRQRSVVRSKATMTAGPCVPVSCRTTPRRSAARSRARRTSGFLKKANIRLRA